ncbi:hypothetical protein Pelo_9725 [Pelomyxa schiedti]|nr:hypothetical protein Pelo_9725 [Pelomyxa schiedti]
MNSSITVYEGEWESDEWNGCGTWYSPHTGDIYHGQFDHNKRSGYGRILFGDAKLGGGSYVGGWKDDVFHGRGVRIWDDGTRYEGDWVSEKENGAGTKTWARDGTSIAGVWKNGDIVSGTKRWPNGDEFTGKFAVNGLCGEGMATFRCGGPSSTNTITLVGTFKENVFQETKCGGGWGLCCSIGHGDFQLEEKAITLEREVKELEGIVDQQSKEKQEALLKSTQTFETLKKKLEEQTEVMVRQIKELTNILETLSKEKEEALWETKRTQHKFEEQTELMGLQTKQLQDQVENFEHTLQHLQKGMWVKASCPENSNNRCVMKEVSVTLERHNITFHESFCMRCPLDKIVKMEVEKRFGVDESQQAILLVVGDTQEELLLSLLPQSTSSPEEEVRNTPVAQVKVRMKPVMTMMESDLSHVSTLHSGCYGTVYKYIHIPSSKEVAVKTLELVVTPHNVERFRLEAEIVSGLRNPNIVKCLGTCTTKSEKLLIVSELMFCSLRQLLKKQRLDFKQLVSISLGVANGMDSLHRYVPWIARLFLSDLQQEYPAE